jgi:hypothetical protein
MRGGSGLIIFTVLFIILAIIAFRPEKTMNGFRTIMGFGVLLCIIVFGLTFANCGIKALIGVRLFSSPYC